MKKPRRLPLRRVLILFATLALFATACGGSSPEQAAAIAEAETNQAQLVLGGDFGSTQMLDAADGSITSLSDVVTGDRAVLAWYWAPH